MSRGFFAALVAGLALLALDLALAGVVVRDGVVAGLLSPGGLTAGRAALALGYVGVRLLAVFLGPALVVGGAVGLAVERVRGARSA